ncbi:MAG: hypothetical protein E5W83_34000 [Mesorhizobium sp.]|nr:MAG: hypothetical protein E5W83_34000 [Mesorhizobium sp.]
MIARNRDVPVRTLAYAKLYRFVQSPDARDAFLAARKTLFPNGNEAKAIAQWKVIQTYKPFAVDPVLDEERPTYSKREGHPIWRSKYAAAMMTLR